MRKVDVLWRRCLLDGFFQVHEAELSIEQTDGTMSEPFRRLVFERGDAVAAVVRHRDSGELLFAEQFRYPTLGKGEGGGWLTELMAGMVGAGESPEAALRREIEEELGYRAERVEPISCFFVSPGGSSERIWLYSVEVGESGRVSGGGGLRSENEDIRIVRMSPAAARLALREGRLPDAKTVIGLQWLFARDPA